MLARSSVARCVAAVAKTSRHGMAVSVKKATMPAVVARMQSQNAQVRLCSSSRFLSLADEEDGEKKRRRGGEDGEDDGEDNGEEGLEAAEGEAAAEEGEKDGDLELEDEMYKFCVAETDDLDSEIMELYMSDPLKWTPERLARKYHLSKQRVEATIHFQAEEAGLSPEGFVAKVEDAKTLAVQRQKDGAAKLASAEARGDEQEVKRLQKRDRQQQRDVDEVDDEVLTAEETAAALGLDDERYRNPDFFFLNDEFEGYPPLTRRLGKHKSTDKLYPQEAIEIQRLATNNKIEELKSFAKPTDVKNRWKIAVKDTSKNKLPLLVRTEDRSLRLATKEEVLPRSWVRRPAFFAGLSPSDE
ncbi:hypothetical protein Poli38472_008722 [Pythium oligandrum]|uniref:Uncharacterized protein n=1 Tax=Pythium oligandrum TaxID=41045 RepID=A0A8K1C435_PYTOL|nr:hypothetical protein Poli38472_008722 [Pythium oligandrum]|eukprot:TMW56074.1 hypothetical protein Poli38472_008722 [Pythium oligandrum]